jgi:anthranilate phosphoribosyltransferase
VLGVFSEALVEPMAGVLSNLGAVRAMVVHSLDGMDEISLCDETVVGQVRDGQVSLERIAPEEAGMERADVEELAVGSLEESAAAVRAILAGEPGPRRDMVLVNAGAAIHVGGKAETLRAGAEAAAESIDSGRAKEALERLAAISQGDQP